MGGNGLGAADRGGALRRFHGRDRNRGHRRRRPRALRPFRVLPDRDLVERPTRSSEVNYADLALAEAGVPARRPRRCPKAATCASNTNCSTWPSRQRILGEAKIAPGTRRARPRAPGRRFGVRKDPRRARRVLDAHRLRHRKRHRQQPPLPVDGRRQRRLQPAGGGQLAAADPVAVVEPGWQAPGLRQFRSRKFLDLHPEPDQQRRANWSRASAESTARRASRPTARSSR